MQKFFAFGVAIDSDDKHRLHSREHLLDIFPTYDRTR
jgi:hypothetical protein